MLDKPSKVNTLQEFIGAWSLGEVVWAPRDFGRILGYPEEYA